MSELNYTAVFQPEREVGATRIKDQLYIFTGTYPIYYKGDGEFYMFPEHRPGFNELVSLGDNTLMGEFEDYYYSRDFKPLPDNNIAEVDLEATPPKTGTSFRVKDFDLRPVIPYLRKEEDDEDPQISLKTSLEFPISNPVTEFDREFKGFLPDENNAFGGYAGEFQTLAEMTANATTNLVYYVRDAQNFYRRLSNPDRNELIVPNAIRGFGRYYQLDIEVFYRPVFSTEESYVRLDSGDITFDVISNMDPTIEEFTFPLIDSQEIDLPEPVNKFEDDTTPVVIKIENIPPGLRDIRVVFKIIEKGYFRIAQDVGVGIPALVARFIEREVRRFNFQIDEINITESKFSSFPTEDNPTRGFLLRDIWTANKVKEHFGRLLVYGTKGRGDTLYISSNTQLNYFPSNYITSFGNDLGESLNSIVPYMNVLIAQTDSYTWGIKGKNPQDFLDTQAEVVNPERYEAFSINSAIGSVAANAVKPVRNRLYFLSQEGLMELTSLFATDDRYNVRFIDRNIENLIKIDKNATAIQFDDQFWINFPSTGETFRYYIDKEAWVKDTFNFDVFRGIYKFYNKNGVLHFITQPMSINGENLAIYEGVVDESIVSDFGKPITTQFLTSKLNQEYPFHHKKYKELKLDFSIQNQYLPTFEPIKPITEHFTKTNDLYSLTFESDKIKKNGSYRASFDFDITPSNIYFGPDARLQKVLLFELDSAEIIQDGGD